MCLSIGTPKNNKFSTVTSGKLIILGVPEFRPFTTLLHCIFEKWKINVLSIPILKHFMVTQQKLHIRTVSVKQALMRGHNVSFYEKK